MCIDALNFVYECTVAINPDSQPLPCMLPPHFAVVD